MAGPAAASTAQLVDVVLPPYCKYNPPGVPCLPGSAPVVVYQAGPGERNRVSLTGGREEVRISDPAAVISTGAGCSPIDRHSVRCSAAQFGIVRLFVATGAGADTVRSGLPARDAEFTNALIVSGGRGDDVLVGGPSGERLYAGSGADVLRGRGGEDLLSDASAPDSLRSGDPSPFLSDEGSIAVADPGRGRDSFDGGNGRRDIISYEARRTGVRVDLANTAAIGGAPGEHDSVEAVESAVGTAANDRLAGNRRSNWLIGGDGDDRIAGRGRNDSLEGGNGRDVMLGGPGDEQLSFGGDEAPDRAFCGAGTDSLFGMAPGDFLNDDCERLFFGNFGERLSGHTGEVRSLLPLRPGQRPLVLSALLFCAPFDVHAPCPLELELRVRGPASPHGTAPPPGTLLGSTSEMIALGEAKPVSLEVSPRGLKLLRRHKALRVSVTTNGEPPFGPAGYLTVLRSP
jgi:Ca2+-binding RTX toxin-like protein